MISRQVARNSVLNLLDMTFLSERVRADPSVYGLAVSSACDLRCPHCMREAMGVRENELMKPEDLEPFVAEFRSARRVSLFGLGEPFLNPAFFDFVAMFKRLGVEVSTSTHGMTLTPEIRNRILDSGLDDLNISMDGATKSTFERLRLGARFDEVVANVSALRDLKIERKSPLPALSVNMTVMRDNMHEIGAMVHLAHGIGAAMVCFSTMVAYTGKDLERSAADTPELARILENAGRDARRLGIEFIAWRQKPAGWVPEPHDPDAAWGCSQLWSNQIIEPDGRMKLCCYIEEDVADVFASGPRAAINCDALAGRRRAMLEGRVRVECQGCMYLRERTPAWIQSQLNEAARMVRNEQALTEEDRAELEAEIARAQALKDALHPAHECRRVGAGSDPEFRNAHRAWDRKPRERELPIY